MINSNLKTQVQARINAVSGSTTLAELLRIKQAAKGLSCDETKLSTEATSKLNALSGAATLDDLVTAGVLTDGPSNVLHYQVPHTVQAGDDLWIDGLGLVTDKQYPYSAVASTAETAGIVGQHHLVASGGLRTGVVRFGSISTISIGFSMQLSDGNWMVGLGAQINAPGTQHGLKLYVLNATRDKILSSTTVELRLSASYDSYYSSIIGIRETAANSFRVYYAQAASGASILTTLAFHTLTYNTGSKAVSSAAGAIVHTLGSGEFDWSRAAPRHNQGQRYQVLGSTAENLLCLDMQNGTVTSYAAVGAAGFPVTEFDESTASNEWAVVRANGGTPYLAKGGTTTTKALPASLTSDGCFGSGWTVRMLEARRFIAKRANTGVCTVKLVAFDATYDNATIWTLDAAHPDTASSAIGAAFKRADGLYVVENGLVGVSAFHWDGASAPTQYRTQRKLTKNIGDIKAGCLQSTDKVIRAGFGYATSSSGPTTSSATTLLTLNAATYLPFIPQKLGRALTNTAASGLAEVQLFERSRFVGDDLKTGVEYAYSQQVATLLEFDSAPTRIAAWNSNDTLNESDLYGLHATEYNELANASALTSLGSGGAVSFDGSKTVFASAARTADTSQYVAVLTPHTFFKTENYAGSPSATGIYRVKCNKPFAVFIAGQNSMAGEGA